jgi:nitrogen fixation/metabolism regulation signal transduction histidine kinase
MSDRPNRIPRNLVLDARFQFKYTGILVGSVALVLSLSGLFLVRTTNTARDVAAVAVDEAQRALNESRANAKLAKQNALLADPDNEDLAAIIDADLKKSDEEAAKKQTDIQEIRKAVDKEVTLMKRLLGGTGLLTVLVLLFTGLFVTHRIVGPVHKMKRLLRRVGTGKLAIKERLRRGDELEDLFDTFLQMTWSLSALQRGQLATIEATLKEAEKCGASRETLEGLRALRAQTALSLGIEQMMRRSQVDLRVSEIGFDAVKSPSQSPPKPGQNGGI